MTNAERRRILQLGAVTIGASVLPGCGGGGGAGQGDGTAGDESLRSPLGKASSSEAASPGPNGLLGASGGAMQFMVSSPKALQLAPFCLGFAFRQGDVPAGQTVASSAGTLQVVPKNTWPDGSLKFAILSGRVPLSANAPLAVNLERAAKPWSRAALTTADLKRTRIRAQVSAGSLGSASWAGNDWDTFTEAWISGPEMSSWIYRKPIGTDAHLVACLEVRLFAGGGVEVLPYVENGYLNVAGPTVKSATFDFSLSGISRFNGPIILPHHTRTPLIQGTALSHWFGVDLGVLAWQDPQYLQATEVVPSYFATTTSMSDGYSIKATSYSPLQQGDYRYGPDQTDYMPNSGYGEPIGLVPGWEAKLLTATPEIYSGVYAAVIRNGYSAGRYPIHYRDERTQRVPAFSAYPTTCLADYRNDGSGFKSQGGSSTGTYTPAIVDTTGTLMWDTAHSPAVGYLPYLLTGRHYFLEETQFAAAVNFLGNDSTLRNSAQGVHQPAYQAWQVRSCAWGLRALSHALSVTPDGDPLQAEFRASVQANIDFYHRRYVAQPNNPLGFIFDWDTGPNGAGIAAPWQADFVTGVVGYMLSMGLPLAAGYQDKLAGFMVYTAKSIIGRLGTGQSPDWWYINAFPYQAAVSPRPVPDWAGGTGPWFASWREAYQATYTPPPPWLGSTEGTLAFEYPAPGDVVRGFLANAMPAITYAVRHGVPGAQAAYDRLIGASNFASFLPAFNLIPVWATKPASGAASSSVPAWWKGKPLNEWFAISGTAGAGGAPLNDYSGFALTKDGVLAAGAAGGHAGSRDNRVVSLNLMADAPTWRVLNSASGTAPDDVPYNPDGKPASRHTYVSTIYVPYFDRVMLFGVRFTTPGASTFEYVDGFNVKTGAWDGVVPGSPGTSGSGYANILPGYYGAVIDGSGNVWSQGAYAKYTPSTNSWAMAVVSPAPHAVRYPWAWDGRRGQLFGLCFGDGERNNEGLRAIKQVGATQVQVTFNSSPALAQFMADRPSYAGMDYDAANDRFLFFSADHPARVYVITPNDGAVWDMSLLALGTGSAALPDTGKPLVGKFKYVPALKGFVCLPDAAQELYFIRTA